MSCNDGIVRLWDRDKAILVQELKPGKSGSIARYVTFAGDARSLALFDGRLCIRELASGGERLQITLNGGPTLLAYSSDDRFLACGETQGRITIQPDECSRSKWQASVHRHRQARGHRCH